MKSLSKKLLSVILLVSLLMSFGVFQTSAVIPPPNPIYYAYSVGTVWPNGDNFRTNAINAGNIYRTMSSITGSYYNDTPTYTYFTGNNPGGTPRIASRLVFLNGHANSDYIYFSYVSNGVTQECAVRKSTTGTYLAGSNTYYAAGLSSVDMSTCYLISFVGCGTASGTSNLKTKAVERGAQYALGFSGDITSRSGEGPSWLNAFNNKIAAGYDPYNALYYAASVYPSCDLSLYGDVDMKSIPGTGLTEQETTVEGASPDSESTSTDSISVDSMLNITEKVSLKDHQNDFSGMIQKVKSKNNSFDPSSYKAYVNCVNKEENSGFAVFYYCIGGVVETNSAYIMEFKNGKSKAINENKNNKISSNIENRVLGAINLFKNSEKYASMQIKKTDKVNVKDRFFFDIETNELRYEIFTYTKTEKSSGVFVTVEGYSSAEISY